MNIPTLRKYHRAFGVYGICVEDSNLLVINKNRGRYKNRFDLPGGSLEDGESLVDCLKREFVEETSYEIKVIENIGVVDFKLPWDWNGFTDVHHIAVFYLVQIIGGEIGIPEQFAGQDSLGALWVSVEDVSLENASPLVLKALEWLKTNKLGIETVNFVEWKII